MQCRNELKQKRNSRVAPMRVSHQAGRGTRKCCSSREGAACAKKQLRDSSLYASRGFATLALRILSFLNKSLSHSILGRSALSRLGSSTRLCDRKQHPRRRSAPVSIGPDA